MNARYIKSYASASPLDLRNTHAHAYTRTSEQNGRQKMSPSNRQWCTVSDHLGLSVPDQPLLPRLLPSSVPPTLTKETGDEDNTQLVSPSKPAAKERRLLNPAQLLLTRLLSLTWCYPSYDKCDPVAIFNIIVTIYGGPDPSKSVFSIHRGHLC